MPSIYTHHTTGCNALTRVVVSTTAQVFVMTGWYPCVKKALIEKGWAQNPDRDSPFFDLKWTLHSQDMRTTEIQPWQLCNHFFKVTHTAVCVVVVRAVVKARTAYILFLFTPVLSSIQPPLHTVYSII